MHQSAPLKLIFATVTNKDKQTRTQIGFYDLFGGIPEVLPADDERLGPELVISPINRYSDCPNEVLTLWVTPEEKEKIGQTIRGMLDTSDPFTAIFNDKPMPIGERTKLTAAGFCAEALRAALPILPNIPANCITPQKLYTVLKLMGGI